jgi:hypothetical protein
MRAVEVISEVSQQRGDLLRLKAREDAFVADRAQSSKEFNSPPYVHLLSPQSAYPQKSLPLKLLLYSISLRKFLVSDKK